MLVKDKAARKMASQPQRVGVTPAVGGGERPGDRISRRRNRGRWLAAISGFVAVSWLVSGSSRAFEAKDLLAYKAGPFIFRQKLAASAQLNDNIFWSDGSFFPKTTDLVGIFSPSITAELGRPETPNRLSLGYSLDGLVYLHNSEQNAIDHHIDLDAYFRGDRLSSTTSARVGFLSSIFNGAQRFEEGIFIPAGKVDRTQYSFNEKLEYDITPKISSYLAGRLNGMLYGGETIFYDTLTWRLSLGGTYAVRPKWRLLSEVYYGQQDQQPNSDLRREVPTLDIVGGMVGVRTELTARLAGTAKVGYEYSEYADGQPGVNDPVFFADLTYRVTDRISANLGLNRRSIVAGIGGRGGLSNTGNVGVNYRIGVRHPLLLGATFRYGSIDWFDDRGTQELISAGVSATYQIRVWLAAMLAYDHEQQNADFLGARTFTVNRVTASVILGY